MPYNIGVTERVNALPPLTTQSIGATAMADQSLFQNEQWRPVPNYEGLYEVSNMGRLCRVGVSHGAIPGRILRQSTLPFGHRTVSLWRNNVGKRELVHRIVARAFLGEPPSRHHEVAHWDGNAANNTVTNLRWATSKENKGDQLRHGTRSMGERHGKSRFTDNQVRIIRRRRDAGEMLKLIAADFGVRPQTIGKIALRRRWKHI